MIKFFNNLKTNKLVFGPILVFFLHFSGKFLEKLKNCETKTL